MPDMFRNGMLKSNLVAEAKLGDASQFLQTGRKTVTVDDTATFYLSNIHLKFIKELQCRNYFQY